MGSTENEFNSLAQRLIVTPHGTRDRFVLLIQSALWPLNLVTSAAVTWITGSMAAVIDHLRAERRTANEGDLAPGSSSIRRSFWKPSILDKSIQKCLPGYAVTSTTALIPVSRERTGVDPSIEIDVAVSGALCIVLHLACQVSGHRLPHIVRR
jgi:hypothetical protein